MIKFGTGGWRAIIGDEFIKANIVSLAQAVADDIIEKELIFNLIIPSKNINIEDPQINTERGNNYYVEKTY